MEVAFTPAVQARGFCPDPPPHCPPAPARQRGGDGVSPTPSLASHPTDTGLFLTLTLPAFNRAGLSPAASPDIQLQEHPSPGGIGPGAQVRAAPPHAQGGQPEGEGSHTWGAGTLPPHPGDGSAPNNAHFSINVHFLKHFQQRCPGLPVHASMPPLPAAWRVHHTAHHHPQTAAEVGAGLWSPKSPSHPASPDGAVLAQGRRRRVSMALHLMEVSGQS